MFGNAEMARLDTINARRFLLSSAKTALKVKLASTAR